LRVFSFIIVLYLLIVSGLYAEVEVIFDDGTPEWRKNVQEYVKKQGIKTLPDSVTNYLVNYGFLDNYIRIARQNDNDNDILFIKFGGRYNIGRIIFEPVRCDTLEINQPFDEANINSLIDSIIFDYQSRGYYYTSLVPIEWIRRDSLIDCYMRFDDGPMVTVSSIELEGLHHTRANYLRKYISITPGDTLYPDKVQNSSFDFERLEFIELKEPPQIIPEVGLNKAIVQYRLSELRQYFIEGAAGYIPDDDGYFVWMLNLMGRNIFGGSQRAGLFVDQRERYKSIFRVFYGQPLFLFGPDYAELEILTRDYRDEFYEFGVGLSYDLYVGRNLSLNSSLGWKNVEPSDTLSRSFEVYDVGFAVNAGNIKVSRSAPIGFAMDWRLKYSGRRYKPLGGDSVLTRSVYNDARSDLTGEISLPLFSFLTDYHLANIKTIESPEKPLPLSELFLFGGAGTFRGYRNDQFAARRLLLFKSELRCFVSEMDFVYPFYDIAYYDWYDSENDSEAVKHDDIKYGYGFGISLSSTRRQLRIELSWGESTVIDEPRLNIVLSNLF